MPESTETSEISDVSRNKKPVNWEFLFNQQERDATIIKWRLFRSWMLAQRDILLDLWITENDECPHEVWEKIMKTSNWVTKEMLSKVPERINQELFEYWKSLEKDWKDYRLALAREITETVCREFPQCVNQIYVEELIWWIQFNSRDEWSPERKKWLRDAILDTPKMDHFLAETWWGNQNEKVAIIQSIKDQMKRNTDYNFDPIFKKAATQVLENFWVTNTEGIFSDGSWSVVLAG